MNAISVPIDTSSPRIPIGSSPARVAARKPVISVETPGVLKVGWILPNSGGNRPSRDIVSQIRACGMIIVRITEVRPARAPQMTHVDIHRS